MGFDELAPETRKNLDPPGYDASVAKDAPSVSPASQRKKDSGMLQRKQQALYARATAPIKNMALFCFMAWMSGNSIQIFSIMMTFQLLSSPMSAILSSGQMFPREEDWPQLDIITPRLLFCLIQCGQLAFGLWKLNGMGLLPVFPSDWISTMSVPPTLEHSYTAVPAS